MGGSLTRPDPTRVSGQKGLRSLKGGIWSGQMSTVQSFLRVGSGHLDLIRPAPDPRGLTRSMNSPVLLYQVPGIQVLNESFDVNIEVASIANIHDK